MLDLSSTARPEASGAPLLMVAELEHRIANEYALAVASLSLAAARSKDAETTAALAGAAQRLRDFADAHRALQAPAAPGPADLGDHLQRLCDALVRASLAERGIGLTLVREEIILDAEQCWRVALIVSELITNAVRHGLHGKPGEIHVEIGASASVVYCRVSDNGRPSGPEGAGRGTRLITALAQELGGHFDRIRGPTGTTAVLWFPRQAEVSHAALLGADDTAVIAS